MSIDKAADIGKEFVVHYCLYSVVWNSMIIIVVFSFACNYEFIAIAS